MQMEYNNGLRVFHNRTKAVNRFYNNVSWSGGSCSALSSSQNSTTANKITYRNIYYLLLSQVGTSNIYKFSLKLIERFLRLVRTKILVLVVLNENIIIYNKPVFPCCFPLQSRSLVGPAAGHRGHCEIDSVSSRFLGKGIPWSFR